MLRSIHRTMKIYTRTGDKGTSSLYSGQRAPKTHPIFEALGAVDELSSALGVVRSHALLSTSINDGTKKDEILEQVLWLQCQLQDLNSHIATPPPVDTATNTDSIAWQKYRRVQFDTQGMATKQLETWIDEMTSSLPALTQFILPGGGNSLASSYAHVARTTCRRAERRIVELVQLTEHERQEQNDHGVGDKDGGLNRCAVFVNRLSDYLFTLARYLAHIEGDQEVFYKKASTTSGTSSNGGT